MKCKVCTKCGESRSISLFPLCRGIPRARCKPCHVLDAKSWVLRNHDIYKQRQKGYRMKTALLAPKQCLFPSVPEFMRKERYATRRKEWILLNKKQVKEAKNRWAVNNLPKILAKTRAYQARKRHATPSWAEGEKDLISAIYSAAAEFRKAGFDVHVDHLVPLNSLFVQGFHCAANLAVVPATKNRSKGNRTWPDGSF